jgi:trans-aconitate 2-methyltransferase
VLDPADYAQHLMAAGCAVDAWSTTYVHVFPWTEGDHPVLVWLDGTALNPMRQALGPAEWPAFRAAVGEGVAAAYPATDGIVYYPFRRVFVVARVG